MIVEDLEVQLTSDWQFVLDRLGLGEQENFRETPKRAARAFLELIEGYWEDPKQHVKLFSSVASGLVVVPEVTLASLCAHHILPYFGKCYIGYVPDGQLLGVSKFSRIVQCLSRRLTVQEELTADIADFIEEQVEPLGVIVVLRAKHTCMMIRGREEQSAYMATSEIRGKFIDDLSLKEEFFAIVSQSTGLI